MTSGALAKLAYQRTQSPFACPMSVSFTDGTALMKMSARRKFPLI